MALFLPRGPEVDLSQVKWLVPAFGVTKVRWGMAWHRRGRWVFWLWQATRHGDSQLQIHVRYLQSSPFNQWYISDYIVIVSSDYIYIYIYIYIISPWHKPWFSTLKRFSGPGDQPCSTGRISGAPSSTVSALCYAELWHQKVVLACLKMGWNYPETQPFS